MILNLTNDATPLPKLGMRTTRQHVERAAQTAAYGKEVQVTPHLVFVVIMECAKQGKKSGRCKDQEGSHAAFVGNMPGPAPLDGHRPRRISR